MVHMWTNGVAGIKTSYQYIQAYDTYLKFFSRLFLLVSWTIDVLIECCPYSRVTKFTQWNCPCKLCRRLSSIWNGLDNWFGDCQLIGFVRTVVFVDRLLIRIVWTIDVWCFLTIEAVWSNDLGVSLLVGIVLTTDFRDCALVGINWTIDVWCFQLFEIVQANDLGHCLSIGIVLKIVFTGCLLIRIARTIDVWCFQLIGIIQKNDLRDGLFSGIVRKIVFTGCLLNGIA